MPKYTIDGTTLSDVADAVRELDGNPDTMTPAQMASRIRAVQPGGADLSVITDDYDTTATYDVGDYCIHECGLYVCTTAISTAEAWTAGHWEEVTVGDELSDLKSDLNDKLTAPQTAGTQGQVLTSDGQGGQSWEDSTGGGGTVTDVQINNTSIVENGVANVPVATGQIPGVVKAVASENVNGIRISVNGVLVISPANSEVIKEGSAQYKPITPNRQHESTFYGLAKAAGDTTQSSSSNAVGTYTDAAQSKIHEMLDAPVTVSGTTPTITGKAGIRYICGEVSTLSITAPESGCIDVVFTSGSTPTVLTVTSAKTGVTAIKWMNGFDPTSLDADTTYELNILDGELGVSGSWT